MALQYTINFEDSTIVVRGSGTADRQSIAQLWQEIVAACKEHNCFYILGFSDLDKPLSITEAFDHQAIFLEAGVTIDHRIAWVDKNPQSLQRTQLVESVLLNRGLANGRVFTDEFEARRWLRNR